MRRIHSAVVVLAIVAASCNSNVVRGIRIARYSAAESRSVVQRFLIAAAARDTLALRALATDSVLQELQRAYEDGRLNRDFAAAGRSNHIDGVEVVLTGADVRFTYVVDRQERNGVADVRYLDGHMRVSRFGLLVEY